MGIRGELTRAKALFGILAAAAALAFYGAIPGHSQNPPPSATPLPPQQLDDLVAPIALYPDPLLGEMLAAATYPTEIVEADQWSGIIRTGSLRSSWTRQRNRTGIPASKGWSPFRMCSPCSART